MIFSQTKVGAFYSGGAVCITLGLLLLKFRPQEFMKNYIFSFHKGGEIYNWWVNSSEANVYLKAYAFNITNAAEFMAGKEKMKLQEVGPFVYREIHTQEDAIFNKNGTITSKPRYQAVWDPELNKYDENITLYVPNVPMLSWANKVATEHPILTIPTNSLIYQTNNKPIQRITWREYGFGHENSLVILGHTLFPKWLPVDKIGLVNLINDHSGVIATLHTGVKNIQLSGLVESYNGLHQLPQWPSPCNNIQNATLGFKVKTNMADNEDFLLHFKGACRTLPFVSSGPKVNKYGVPTRLYKIHRDAFDNGARNKENLCYCKNNDCLPDGLSDVSYCFYGFSSVISYPHFYNANSSLLERIEGLKPQQDLHETYLRINQDTGIITEFSYRVQLNLKLEDISSIANCSRFSNMVLPILWMDLTMPSIPFASKMGLFLLLRVQPITDLFCAYGLITIGISLFFYARHGMLVIFKFYRRQSLVSKDLSIVAQSGHIRKEAQYPENEVCSKLIKNDENV